MKIDPVEKLVSEYSVKRPIYRELAEKAKALLTELIDKKIDYYEIQSRVKTIESYRDKVARKFATSDRNPIQDMAGIRVIVYTLPDIEEISEVIKKEFEIGKQNVEDKSELLGIDKVGYRSTHFIAAFNKQRLNLSEYKKFKGLYFEIQVRTIMQHAWAQIGHSRIYKASTDLPDIIQRRFNLLSGTIELVEHQFEQISNEIDTYSKDVADKTKTGKLDIPINSTSLIQFLTDTFKEIRGIEPEIDAKVIDELHIMKINTLKDLKQIIPPKFEEKFMKHVPIRTAPTKGLIGKIKKWIYSFGLNGTSFSDLLRIIMIIHDLDGYFKNAWKKHFMYVDDKFINVLTEFDRDPNDVVKYIKAATEAFTPSPTPSTSSQRRRKTKKKSTESNNNLRLN